MATCCAESRAGRAGASEYVSARAEAVRAPRAGWRLRTTVHTYDWYVRAREIITSGRHTRLDAWRKQRRVQSREVLVASVPEGLYQMLSEAPREEDEFDRLIASLPDAQREVIVMLKVSGMSLEEVAKATSSTIGAVKQKAHRAYETVRRALGKDRENAG